ncbi:MAG: YifB family Mg chelatase-like AAA ATPase [Pseudomonadota bacterium]|nr:YifB family Mg chelatase-like AAA ATPase [Pseudomonadota bacterium]
MSLALVHSRALLGAQAPAVTVEVHVANGLPAFHIVGLPAATVRESRERVRAALVHCGFAFPNRRLTVNLAPADLPKDSGRFDLPIAIGILVATGQLPAERVDGHELVGELSLTGALRPSPGLLAIALGLRRDHPDRRLVVPAAGGAEAAVVPGIRAFASSSLADVCAYFRGEVELSSPSSPAAADETGVSGPQPDFADVLGQPAARRAAELAAAGRHSLLLIGPPGSGKSMIATRLASILPPLAEDEALATGAIAALRGLFDPRQLHRRPFRNPHHSASMAALVGGGNPPRPGEASLAHLGVLFLDEIPEFGRAALDALREPLETGRVEIARAGHAVTLPADFQLVAAMNPCPCGRFGSADCRCAPERVERYQQRVSGPVLDRIDLQLTVAPTDQTALLSAVPAEPSAGIARRVARAWRRQLDRQGGPNARLDAAGIGRHAPLTAEAHHLFAGAARRLRLSGRGMHRVLRVARTIADLEDTHAIGAAHVAEAVGYRRGLFRPATDSGPEVS